MSTLDNMSNGIIIQNSTNGDREQETSQGVYEPIERETEGGEKE